MIVTAHCENAELIGRLQQFLLAQGKTGPEWHEPSRPESVEAEGTNRFATFLENTGTAGYVVHLSSEGALNAALAAKSRGIRVWVESVLPHLLLDKTYAERPGVEGMKHVMSPPLRDGATRRSFGMRWRRASSIRLRPIIARSTRRRNSSVRMPLRRFPTAFRGSRSA